MKTCTWAEDADGNWRTGCNEIHIIIDGTPSENGYVYCPYCGAKIETVIYNASGERCSVAHTLDPVVGSSSEETE